MVFHSTTNTVCYRKKPLIEVIFSLEGTTIIRILFARKFPENVVTDRPLFFKVACVVDIKKKFYGLILL